MIINLPSSICSFITRIDFKPTNPTDSFPKYQKILFIYLFVIFNNLYKPKGIKII